MATDDRQAIPLQIYQNYNLTPAVYSLLLTRYEYHSRQEVYDGHYFPTDRLLQQLAQSQPSLLTAIASQPATLYPKWPGQRVNICLLIPDKTIIFIGCVCDRDLTNQLYDDALARCRSQNLPEKVAAIIRRGKVYVRRSEWLCAITTLSEQLATDILTEALRRYLDLYSPSLTNLPIEWLNDTNPALASTIHRELAQRAADLANPPIETLSISELSRRMQEDDMNDLPPLPPDNTSNE